MAVVLHKFREHKVEPLTEILIIGIFVPDTEPSDFFYGRSRNFLWHLLPQCWGMAPLKEASLAEKKKFMASRKIDFADLIYALDADEENGDATEDASVDSHVHQWTDLTGIIDTLPNLKAVYFTRKTFAGIPNMRAQMTKVAGHCASKNIRVCKLDTPARFYSVEKLQQWKDTIVGQTTCLRV
ncbi:hypothetical protein [Desertivirga xinjiangensis]|uniref:hypothetical protein n=1 Tax=Desertivirga xinjiangensis TaxID=539206 RepID=UPI00210DE149|nr:hypothetical protein [Pedobacter xinjiangensis]